MLLLQNVASLLDLGRSNIRKITRSTGCEISVSAETLTIDGSCFCVCTIEGPLFENVECAIKQMHANFSLIEVQCQLL